MSALSVNHERTIKAVAKLNDRAYRGTRYVALIEWLDKPGVIVVEERPYNSYKAEDFKEEFRYTTKLGQTIGTPITYSNKYSAAALVDSMCTGVYNAEERRRRKFETLRARERNVSSLEREIAELQERLLRAQSLVESAKADLGVK